MLAAGTKTAQRSCSNSGARDTTVVDCGRPPEPGGTYRWNYTQCGPTETTCVLTDPAHPTAPPVPIDAEATVLTTPNPGENPLITTWCPTLPTPTITTAEIREHAIRLLPTVPIGTTVGTTTPYTLTNIQTIFWAPTTPVRDLGTVTITGTPIHLRATFHHADWNFGDGTTDTTTTPGKAYIPHTCNDQLCPDYYGHTYHHNGTTTATLTITWTTDYNPNNTTWHTIDNLTAPTTHTTIPIYSTKTILVTPPS